MTQFIFFISARMPVVEDWSSQPPLIEAITRGQPGLNQNLITTKTNIQMLGGRFLPQAEVMTIEVFLAVWFGLVFSYMSTHEVVLCFLEYYMSLQLVILKFFGVEWE